MHIEILKLEGIRMVASVGSRPAYERDPVMPGVQHERRGSIPSIASGSSRPVYMALMDKHACSRYRLALCATVQRLAGR